jgi:hypothetical protein
MDRAIAKTRYTLLVFYQGGKHNPKLPRMRDIQRSPTVTLFMKPNNRSIPRSCQIHK